MRIIYSCMFALLAYLGIFMFSSLGVDAEDGIQGFTRISEALSPYANKDQQNLMATVIQSNNLRAYDSELRLLISGPYDTGITSTTLRLSSDFYKIREGVAHDAIDYTSDYRKLVAPVSGKIVALKRGGKDCSNTQLANQACKIDIQDSNTGLIFTYAHLLRDTIPEDLKVGDTITAGTYVGDVGNTGMSKGDHLHYGVYTTDPLLAKKYYGQKSQVDWGFPVRFVIDPISLYFSYRLDYKPANFTADGVYTGVSDYRKEYEPNEFYITYEDGSKQYLE